MMPQAEVYPFVTLDPALGAASLLPYLPIKLTFRQQTIPVMGLLDTGATVNVLPYDIGTQLGAVRRILPRSQSVFEVKPK